MIAELVTALALGGPGTQASCPVTKPVQASGRYGSQRLWTRLPAGGVIRARSEAGGSLSWKLAWIPDRWRGELTVQGSRLDAPGRMRVLSVNWGYSSTGKGSWASAVTFPAIGCYRITGRSAAATLSYVVKVVSA